MAQHACGGKKDDNSSFTDEETKTQIEALQCSYLHNNRSVNQRVQTTTAFLLGRLLISNFCRAQMSGSSVLSWSLSRIFGQLQVFWSLAGLMRTTGLRVCHYPTG